jgi:hypothetical protein
VYDSSLREGDLNNKTGLYPFESDLDEQLGQTDLNKLAEVAGEKVLECGPFYSCFFNRFTGLEDDRVQTTDESSAASV